MSEHTQAQRLIENLTEQVESMDHVIIAFSKKGDPLGAVTVGATGHTPAMWTLGALDYVRWHLFNNLTLHRLAQRGEQEEAEAEYELLKANGVKAS